MFILIFQINFQDLNINLRKLMNKDIEFCTKNQACQEILKNIHLQLLVVVEYKKHILDYRSLIPQILFQTLYLSQLNIVVNQFENTVGDITILPIKTDEINENGIYIVHFVRLGKKLKLPSEKYDQYCLHIHIGAIKCLPFEKKINFIIDSIEIICDWCLRHSEVNLEALKHLTECISLISTEQWKIVSKYVYVVLMGQMNHHLPSIHDQCILLFQKCLDLEDIDYILKIVMTEISWSLRIKFYMLTVIATKYGVKKVKFILSRNVSFFK